MEPALRGAVGGPGRERPDSRGVHLGGTVQHANTGVANGIGAKRLFDTAPPLDGKFLLVIPLSASGTGPGGRATGSGCGPTGGRRRRRRRSSWGSLPRASAGRAASRAIQPLRNKPNEGRRPLPSASSGLIRGFPWRRSGGDRMWRHVLTHLCILSHPPPQLSMGLKGWKGTYDGVWGRPGRIEGSKAVGAEAAGEAGGPPGPPGEGLRGAPGAAGAGGGAGVVPFCCERTDPTWTITRSGVLKS